MSVSKSRCHCSNKDGHCYSCHGALFNLRVHLKPTFAHGVFSAFHSNKRCSPHSTRQHTSGRSDAVNLLLPKGMSLLYFYFLIFIGVQLIYNIVLVSAIQQSESVLYIYIHLFPPFQIDFPDRSLQSQQQSSLRCTGSRSLLVVCLIYYSSSNREGSGNPIQYPCLGNPMGRGAWWATAHGVAKSQTQPSD